MKIKIHKNTLVILAALLCILLVAFVVITKGIIGPKTLKEDNFESELQNLKSQSNSTEVDQIENDLKNTNLDNLDEELNEIEEELNSAL